MKLGDLFTVGEQTYEFVHEGCVDPGNPRCNRRNPITVYQCYSDGVRRYSITLCIERPSQ